MNQTKGNSTDLYTHVFRVLYSPIDTLHEIYNILNNSKKVNTFILKTVLAQSFIYSFYFSSFLIYSYYCIPFKDFINLLRYFFLGSSFLILVFITITYFYFLLRGFLFSETEHMNDNLIINFARATTRLWVWGLIGGIIFSFIWMSLNGQFSIVYFLTFFLFYFGSRGYQLMFIAGSVDSNEKKFEYSKILSNYSINKKTQFLLIIATCLFLLSVALVTNFYPDLGLYVYYIDFILILLIVTISWLAGIFVHFELFLFFPKYSLLKGTQVLNIFKHSEILYYKPLVSDQLSKLYLKSQHEYFQMMEFLFEYSPFRDSILKRFRDDILTDKYNIEQYLQISEKGKLFFENINFNLEDVTYLNYTGQIIYIDQLMNESNFVESFLKYDTGIDFFNRIKDVLKKQNVYNRDLNIEKLLKEINDLSPTFKTSYLGQVTTKIFDKYVDYALEKRKDNLNYEITIELLHTQIEFTNKEGVLILQLKNNTSSKLDLDVIRLEFKNGHDIIIERPRLLARLIVEPDYYCQLEFKLFTGLTGNQDVEIKITYSINDKHKFKQVKQKVLFSNLDSFKPFLNPYGLKAVDNDYVFVGREKEIGDIINNVSPNIISHLITILAERRIGKTSLAYKIQRLKELNDYDFHYIDLQSIVYKDFNENKFFNHILKKVKDNDIEPESSLEFINHLSDGKKRRIIILDEFDVLFHYLNKDILEQLLITFRNLEHINKPIFILLMPQNELESADIPIQNAILQSGITLKLECLSRLETIRLITKPLIGKCNLTNQSIEHISNQTGGFPHLIQVYMSGLVNFNLNHLKKHHLTIEDVFDFEKETTISFESLLYLFYENMDLESKSILKIFKERENMIYKFNVDQIYSIKNKHYFDKLIKINVILLKNYYYCISSNILLNLVK